MVLIFIGGRFSHAIRKIPAAVDFRVQAEYGGQWHPATPSGSVLRQADKVYGAVNEDLLYARIDGVVSRGKFLLMEFEAI